MRRVIEFTPSGMLGAKSDSERQELAGKDDIICEAYDILRAWPSDPTLWPLIEERGRNRADYEKTFREIAEKSRTEGMVEGRTKSILDVLSSKGITPSQNEREMLESCSDVARLDALFSRSLVMKTGDSLFAS